jgi:hypothetical protein
LDDFFLLDLRSKGAYFALFYIISNVERENTQGGWSLCLQRCIQVEEIMNI